MSILIRLRIAHCSAAAAAATLLGCSMHPLPEDVSRKNTYDIVEKIRCEAVEGLRGVPRDHPILANTYIGYDFDFNIEENNNLGTASVKGNLTLERKAGSPPGSHKIEASPFMERQRKTQRNFRVIENLQQLSNTDCATETTRANWIYPITGAIGMDEIVRTYVGIERLTNFAKTTGTTTELPEGFPTTDTKIPVVFSDVITFTTNLGLGLKPTLTLASVVGNLKVTSASILGEATRKDIHKVTVALARDPGDPVDPPTNSRAFRVQSKDQAYVDRIHGSRSAIYNPRINRAADVVAQKDLPAETRVLLELERRRDEGDEDLFTTRLLELLKPAP